MEFVTIKTMVLVGLMSVGATTSGNAYTPNNNMNTSSSNAAALDSIGQQALDICKNMSACITESALAKQVMMHAKGDWALITWISRAKPKLVKFLEIDVTSQNNQPAPVNSATIKAIATRAIPLLKKLLIQLLDLSPTNAEAFWQCHGTNITAELEKALSAWVTNNNDAQDIKNMLEQEHCTKFIHIMITILAQQIKSAPDTHKAAVAELRDCIINTVS